MRSTMQMRSTVALCLLFFGQLIFAQPARAVKFFDICEAAKNGQTKKVQWLVKAGTQVNSLRRWHTLGVDLGVTPLILAIEYGHLETAAYLFSVGARLTSNHRYVAQVVQTLVRRGRDLGREIEGDLKKLEFLIEAGVDLNDGDYPNHLTPLILAAQTGNLEMAHFLLSHGAQVVSTLRDGVQISAVHAAAAAGHLEMLQFLLKIDPSAVNLAIRSDSFSDLYGDRENLSRESASDSVYARPGGYTSEESTPLRLAVQGGHTEVVQFLLNQGVDPDVSDRLISEETNLWSGVNALAIAIRKENKTAIGMLILAAIQRGFELTIDLSSSSAQMGEFVAHTVETSLVARHHVGQILLETLALAGAGLQDSIDDWQRQHSELMAEYLGYGSPFSVDPIVLHAYATPEFTISTDNSGENINYVKIRLRTLLLKPDRLIPMIRMAPLIAVPGAGPGVEDPKLKVKLNSLI